MASLVSFRRGGAVAAALLVVGGALGACSGDAEETGTAASPSVGSSATGGSASASAVPAASVSGVVAENLDAPWGLALLPGGGALIAERDSGRILLIGSLSPGAPAPVAIGTVPGVVAAGEGGLLGLAVDTAGTTVFAYHTAASDNRVVALPFTGSSLGAGKVILDGIPKAGFHNGGRIVLGPDGNLWIGTGDGGERPNSQNRTSLGGKILRITPTGGVPSGNPFAGSPVYSLGHRNVQGIAFASDGTPYAAEFGQNTYDELNRITAGGNYGWPQVEGVGDDDRYVDPVVTWKTSEASPSGLAIVDDVAYVAGLRGQVLWQVPLSSYAKKPLFQGEYGRLRTVVPVPGGLLLTTSNTDGRGAPAATDDRLLRIALS